VPVCPCSSVGSAESFEGGHNAIPVIVLLVTVAENLLERSVLTNW
jgi:hypothetical protein